MGFLKHRFLLLLLLALSSQLYADGDTVQLFDTAFSRQVGELSFTLQAPYKIIQSQDSGQSLQQLRTVVTSWLDQQSLSRHNDTDVVWPGTQQTLDTYLTLMHPLTVDESMLAIDQKVWRQLGEIPILRYLQSDASTIVLLHADSTLFTIDELVSVYEVLQALPASTIASGSRYLVHVLATVQQILLADLTQLSTEIPHWFRPDPDNYISADLRRSSKKTVSLQRLRRYVDWFPKSYHYLTLTEIRGEGREFSIERYHDRRNSEYQRALERHFPEVAAAFNQARQDWYAQEKAAWGIIRRIGEGGAVESELQNLRLLRDKTDTAFDILHHDPSQYAAWRTAVQHLWQDVAQGFKINADIFAVIVPGDSLWDGKIIRRQFLPIKKGFGSEKLTWNDQVVSPVHFLANPQQIMQGVSRRQRREPNNNVVIFTPQQLSAWSNNADIADSFQAVTAGVMKTAIPAINLAPYLAANPELLREFITGAVVNNVGMVGSAVYHSVDSGHLVLPDSLQVTTASLSGGTMFATGHLAGKALQQTSLLKDMTARTLGMAMSGAAMSLYETGELPHAMVQAVKMAAYSLAREHVGLTDQLLSLPRVSAGNIFAATRMMVSNTTLSFNGGIFEYFCGGYIDPLGYTAPMPIEAGLMSVAANVGMDLVTTAVAMRALHNRSAAPPPPNDDNFNVFMEDFAEYRHGLRREGVAEEALPILLNHGRKTPIAVVLFHELGGTPVSLEQRAREFYARGMNVVTVLADGHGIHPAKLDHFDRLVWLTNADFGFQLAKTLGDNVLVGGFSAGGLLAIEAASRNREQVAGLVLYDPAIAVPAKVVTAIDAKNTAHQEWISINADHTRSPHRWLENEALQAGAEDMALKNGRYPLTAVIAAKHVADLSQEFLDSNLFHGEDKLPFPVFALYMDRAAVVDPKATTQFLDNQGIPQHHRVYLSTDPLKAFKNRGERLWWLHFDVVRPSANKSGLGPILETANQQLHDVIQRHFAGEPLPPTQH